MTITKVRRRIFLDPKSAKNIFQHFPAPLPKNKMSHWIMLSAVCRKARHSSFFSLLSYLFYLLSIFLVLMLVHARKSCNVFHQTIILTIENFIENLLPISLFHLLFCSIGWWKIAFRFESSALKSRVKCFVFSCIVPRKKSMWLFEFKSQLGDASIRWKNFNRWIPLNLRMWVKFL